MTLFASNIRIGLGPTEIVLRASLTNLVLLNCWAFLPINPGMVATEGLQAGGFLGSDFQKMFESHSALGRIGQPDDIAPAVVFLASPDADWITGETLLISGGYR
jgi:hypothetical protein